MRDPRWEGDMKVKRFRDGVFGVVGGREDRVDERGGVLGGSINVVLADNSSPNISFLMSARYILSASSSESSKRIQRECYLAGRQLLLRYVSFAALTAMHLDFPKD